MSANAIPSTHVEARRGVAVLPWFLLALTVFLSGVAAWFFLLNQEGVGREPLPAFYGDLLYLFDAVVVAR